VARAYQATDRITVTFWGALHFSMGEQLCPALLVISLGTLWDRVTAARH